MSGPILRLTRACLTVVGLALAGYALFPGSNLDSARWLAALAAGACLIAAGRWPDTMRIRDRAEGAAVRVGLALTVGFALVAAQLLRMQAINASSTSKRVGADPRTGDVFSNPRTINLATTSPRGAIVDRSGVVLAETKITGGVAFRQYPEPASSYVCGYFSPLKYGLSGLEATKNPLLTGQASENELKKQLDELLGRTSKGDDLTLTLDAALQSQAQDLLGDHAGAIVLLEVATGAVLVLASAPHFDPGKLAAVDDATAAVASAYWAQLSADRARPLVLRATDGLFTPGSTFKTVTASAAIDSGLASPDDVFQDNGSLYVDGHTIVEKNRPDASIGEWTLRDGFAYSLNVVFAQVGLKVGGPRLKEYAERFGFGAAIPFDLPVAVGQVSATPRFLDADSAVADTGFGQGELLTTPLDMAMIAAAIANGGDMMQPYLVAEVRSSSGSLLKTTEPKRWRRPVSAETAATVRDLMINAVENGYANPASVPGYTVGGKTGTAETGTELPHAWFIGFIGADQPRYAVAVVLEHGGEGLTESLGMGRELLVAAITKYS